MAAALSEMITLNISLVVALLQFTPSHVAEANSAIVDILNVPNGQQLFFKASAQGAQIYVCQQKSADYPLHYEWTLKAPDAVLFNQKGQPLGKHYGGPTWESNDGSKVMAIVKSKLDAPEKGAIPWLLLKARSHEGKGVFRLTTWIQRVNTTGGKAPAQGCDESSKDREVRVNYTADYLFYRVDTPHRVD